MEPNRRTETFVRLTLAVGGLAFLGLGLWMAAWPGSFHSALADFGPRNDHDLRDVATFYLALGAVFVMATRRRSWRLPVLAFAVIEGALHSLNHVLDADKAEPSWVGAFDAIALSAATVALAFAAVATRRAARLRRGELR